MQLGSKINRDWGRGGAIPLFESFSETFQLRDMEWIWQTVQTDLLFWHTTVQCVG